LPQPIKKTELNLSAQSAIAYDCEGNQLLYDQEGDKPSAIASITKLFTALVFIENNPGWDSVYQMKTSDRREGGRINLFTGEKVLIKDLFYTSLVASDNTATIALVNSIGITEEEFVKLMNLKAQQLNLKQTKFNDPVGLSNQNISTAREVAIFTREALSNKEIRQASVTKKYQFKTKEGRNKVVYNTDDLLDSLPKNSIRILGGKTGFIDAAGYCFVGQFTNSQGKEIVTVVLGSKSDKERFSQTVKLADWVYQSQIW
jgi:D-alanyl-D-alanine carboxypeptidase